MNPFERTRSGQSNRAAFLGFTSICYIEGDDGKEGEGVDAVFWSAVFNVVRPGATVRFLSRGGKPILESLAKRIISEDISNAYVAMDADYDRYFDDLIEDARIVYTMGYSIENDLFSEDSICEIYKTLAHVVNLAPEVRDFFKDEIVRLERDLRLAVCADALALKAKSSVIPRASPGRLIRLSATNLATVEKGEIRKLCESANIRTRPRQDVSLKGPIVVREHCVGHLFRYAMSLLIRSALAISGKRQNYSQEHIRDVALQILPRILQGNGRVGEYYRALV